jgi:hypothetical protein
MRTILLLALCLSCVAAAPATRPVKSAAEKRPTTFAEAMQEVARLKAEVEKLKAELAAIRNPKPGAEPIRVGMTLKEAEAIAADQGFGDGRRSTLDSDDGNVQTYSLIVDQDTGGRVMTSWRYIVTVRGGKIIHFSKISG